MGSSNSLLFLITTLLVLLLSQLTLAYSRSSHRTNYNTNDLVHTTCTHTPDPAACEATLRSDPRSSASDTRGLTLIMIDVVETKFTNAAKVSSDLAHGSSDPGVIKALKNCVDILNVVVNYNVPTAANAVKLGEPKLGIDAMVDSGHKSESCRWGFPRGKIPSQLSNQLPDCHRFSDITASLIRLMQ